MFGRIRKWLNRRKVKKAIGECIAYAEQPIGGRRPNIRYIEDETAHIFSLLLSGCPHFIIVSSGQELATSVRNLSSKMFRKALVDMAQNAAFRDILTDIVIDINTRYK